MMLTTSFFQKELNEHDKWLNFYGLKETDFIQVEKKEMGSLDWKSYDLSMEDKKLYEPFYFYAADSVYFIDLYSYNILLEKDSSGQLIWMSGDPESKVQLVKTKTLDATTLLFFGSQEFPETAIWRNNHFFEILGFVAEYDKFIPMLWQYDLEKKTITEFKGKKNVTDGTKRYLREVKLLGMKER